MTRWTKSEESVLRECYRDSGMDEIRPRLPGRSLPSIYGKAAKMGLSRANRYGFKNLTGKTFGRLLAKRPVKDRYLDGTVMWECLCRCGEVHLASSHYLISGQVTSCGCKRLVTDRGNLKALHRTYVKLAAQRGLEWELSLNQFESLVRSDCSYCGKLPAQEVRSSSKHSPLIYNGVDRIDPGLGYTKENSASCCKHCNQSKWTSTVEEWTAHMKLVLSYVNRS